MTYYLVLTHNSQVHFKDIEVVFLNVTSLDIGHCPVCQVDLFAQEEPTVNDLNKATGDLYCLNCDISWSDVMDDPNLLEMVNELRQKVVDLILKM